MNSYNPEDNQGALERLGISVQTTPPENILIAGKARSTRFRVSRPHGYSYGDVESYQFDFVIPTLEWYADALHERDLAVHKLGELVDKLEVDLENTKAQLDNKDYNEAIGLAVEDHEQDAEIEALMQRVQALQTALDQANEALASAEQAPISSPDGETSYTHDEVVGFISSAVEEAEKAKDEQYAAYLAQKDSEFAALLEDAKAAAREEAAATAPTGYTEEEVTTAIQSAVSEAVSESVAKAVAETEKAKDAQYSMLLEAQATALSAAEAKAAANLAPTGYSHEEMVEAVEAAIAEKEAEILAKFPEAKSVDQLVALVNDGDVQLKAEKQALETSVLKMQEYTDNLEAYVSKLESEANSTPSAPAPAAAANPTSNHGRPLPKLRADDL